MKQRTTILLLFGSLLLGLQPLSAQECSQLVTVRYYGHGDSSRLAIRTHGNAQYSTAKQKNDVRVLLPNTWVPASYDGARMYFASGLMSRVYIDRKKNDTTVVTVGLRSKAAFRISRMDKTDGLYIDAFPDTVQATTQATPSPDTTLASVHPSVIVPIQTLSLNTLVSAGHTRQQELKDSTVQAKSPAVVPLLRGRSFVLPRINALHVFLAVAFAVLGTSLALLLMRRVSANKPAAVPSTFTVELAEAISEHGHERREVSREISSRSVVESPQDRLVEEDASARMLAKKYGRGLGEVKLSFDLRSRQSERRWMKRVQDLAGENAQPRDNVAVAKEFGIGRGEVDLAVLLHHLKTPKTLKEELV